MKCTYTFEDGTEDIHYGVDGQIHLLGKRFPNGKMVVKIETSDGAIYTYQAPPVPKYSPGKGDWFQYKVSNEESWSEPNKSFDDYSNNPNLEYRKIEVVEKRYYKLQEGDEIKGNVYSLSVIGEFVYIQAVGKVASSDNLWKEF